jgi:glycine/D-amino acid oxidase-like deaminating enzyme/nitrite reductase/ring-hydroxylating ferredoxin subunit
MGSAYFDAHSLWQRSEKPLFQSLNHNLRVHTCVIGAGVAGLTVAYELLKAGQQVAVLDRERLGLGETGLTSAHLSNALDEGYLNLRRMHGIEGARLAADSHTQAINYIERVQREEGIACDFERVDGFLFLGGTQTVGDLQLELDAARAAGLSHVQFLQNAPSRLFATGPCLHYPDQAQFHPLKYLDGLANSVVKMGGMIFTHSEASEVFGGHYAYVKTRQGHKIEAEAIVVATNVPINNWVAVHTKIPAYRSYVIGMTVPQNRADGSLYWDTESPYHYVRLVKDPTTGEDLVLIGGEDHRVGQGIEPELHFGRLEQWARGRLELDTRVVTRWSGQIIEPIDGLAYIGRNPGDEQNVFIATGDSGHGLTHGTIAGLLLRDLILRRDNPWAKLYDPARLYFRSLTNYVKEAAQSTAPYTEWLSEGDVTSIDQIEAGEGGVIREGLRKSAVFKDERGRVHRCSAVCTHLGGIVRWNSAEKTWDCPCHGSRFDCYGEVLNGPANTPLVELDDPMPTSTETLSI